MSLLYETVWCISKYYENTDMRVFSLVNIQENRLVMKDINFRKTDRFICLLTWMHPLKYFITAIEFLSTIGIDQSQCYLMCNTQRQLDDAKSVGFKNSYLINRYFILDPTCFHAEANPKLYDTCIYAEQVVRNRVHWCFHLPKLAIIDAIGKPQPLWDYPKCAWRNTMYLHEDNPIIQQVMRQSYTGLCIARTESICISSIEFFLNGIPVVSSINDTGRMEWYNDYNSILINDCKPETISQAVEDMKQKVLNNEIDPNKIRQDAINLSTSYAQEFVRMTSNLLGSGQLAQQLFLEKYENHFLYQKHWKNFEDTKRLFRD